jgi:hypothetical protein
MAKFTTRVELYGNPSWDDFDNLHEAMRKEGFSRTISFQGDNTVWQLPHAEYNRDTDLGTDAVRDSAKRAAATAWDDFAILVTKANGGRSIYNLKEA